MQAITKMLCPVPESISRSRVEISVQGNEVLAVIKKSVDDQINDIKTKYFFNLLDLTNFSFFFGEL